MSSVSFVNTFFSLTFPSTLPYHLFHHVLQLASIVALRNTAYLGTYFALMKVSRVVYAFDIR